MDPFLNKNKCVLIYFPTRKCLSSIHLFCIWIIHSWIQPTHEMWCHVIW